MICSLAMYNLHGCKNETNHIYGSKQQIKFWHLFSPYFVQGVTVSADQEALVVREMIVVDQEALVVREMVVVVVVDTEVETAMETTALRAAMAIRAAVAIRAAMATARPVMAMPATVIPTTDTRNLQFQLYFGVIRPN